MHTQSSVKPGDSLSLVKGVPLHQFDFITQKIPIDKSKHLPNLHGWIQFSFSTGRRGEIVREWQETQLFIFYEVPSKLPMFANANIWLKHLVFNSPAHV